MQKLVIEGGIPLEGEIFLHGAKNSALPILAGTLLCDGETTLENCPRLTDVFAACRILTHLGCRCMIQEHTVTVQVRDLRSDTIPEALMQEMRSSIIFLGAVLERSAGIRHIKRRRAWCHGNDQLVGKVFLNGNAVHEHHPCQDVLLHLIPVEPHHIVTGMYAGSIRNVLRRVLGRIACDFNSRNVEKHCH